MYKLFSIPYERLIYEVDLDKENIIILIAEILPVGYFIDLHKIDTFIFVYSICVTLLWTKNL